MINDNVGALDVDLRDRSELDEVNDDAYENGDDSGNSLDQECVLLCPTIFLVAPVILDLSSEYGESESPE